MANFFNKLIDAMRFSDDDEDDYNDYLDGFDDKKSAESEVPVIKKYSQKESYKPAAEPAIKPVKQPAKQPVKQPVKQTYTPAAEEPKKPRVVQPAEKSKVVPLHGSKDMELKVIKPTSFSDCQDICDILLNGDAVVVNLEGFDTELAQRVMDFVSGTVYAIRGSINPVSNLVYIVSPENVTISGDVLKLLTSGGVEAPTFSSDF